MMLKKIFLLSTLFCFSSLSGFSAPTSGFFVGLTGGTSIGKLNQNVIRAVSDDIFLGDEVVDIKVKLTSENSWSCLSDSYVGMTLELISGYSLVMDSGATISAGISLSGPSQLNIKKGVEDLKLHNVLRGAELMSDADKTDYANFKSITDVDFLRKERFCAEFLLSFGYFVSDSFEIFVNGSVGISNAEILASFGGYQFAGTIGKINSALGKTSGFYDAGVAFVQKVDFPKDIRLFFNGDSACIDNSIVYSFGAGFKYYLPCHVSLDLSYSYKILPTHNIKFNEYSDVDSFKCIFEDGLGEFFSDENDESIQDAIPESLSKIAVCNYGLNSHNIKFGISLHF